MARCKATTKKGNRCRNQAAPGSDCCRRHDRSSAKRSRRGVASFDVHQNQVRQWLRVLRVAQWFFAILGAGFAVAAVWTLAVFISEKRLAHASVEWPSVEGRVLSSELEFWQEGDRDGGRETTVYIGLIEYEYEVNGDRHTARRVRYRGDSGDPTGTRGKDDAEAAVERYPPGKIVQVHYSPHDPAQAVLEPGTDLFRRRAWVFPVAFLVVGVGFGLGSRPFFRGAMRRSVAEMAHYFGPGVWEAAAVYGISPKPNGNPTRQDLGQMRADVPAPSETRARRLRDGLIVLGFPSAVLAILAFLIASRLSRTGFLGSRIGFWPLFLFVLCVLALGILVYVAVGLIRSRQPEEETRGAPPAEREREIRRHINEIGAEAFPDSPQVTWTIRSFEHKEGWTFAEVEPSRETAGWSRLKFAVHFRSDGTPVLAGCYALTEGLWSCVFTTAGFEQEELDRLHFPGAEEPMPAEEREEWLQNNIQSIGKQAWPENAVTWTLRSIKHKGPYSFAEAEASPADAVGWSRVRFVLLMRTGQPTVVGCYALEEDGWALAFEAATDTPSDWKQLHEGCER